MIIRTTPPVNASTIGHIDDPWADHPWTLLEPPDGDGPAALEFRELAAEQSGEHHPAVAAVIAAAQVEHRRRQRRRTSGLRVVS